MFGFEFYVDPSRCIGCQSCVNACAECDTHRGTPMIHVDYLDRRNSIATVPTVCMHCDDPTCAEVCPADAIKKNEDGVVQSSLKPRCIACSNCVLACPFGVPKMMVEFEQMMNNTANGEISMPFRSKHGWHILQVEDRRQEDMSETVKRNQAYSLLRSRRFEEELPIWLQEIRDEAYVDIRIAELKKDSETVTQ